MSEQDSLTVDQRFNIVVNETFGGWHHVYNRKPNGNGVQFNVYGSLSTHDFNQMTRLVVSCHATRVRADVQQGGPRMLKVFLHPRKNEHGDISAHHPSLDDLIARCEKMRDQMDRIQKEAEKENQP